MKVICWDFDGTLVYSESLWSSSVLTALNETDNNHNILLDDIRKYMATGFTWHTPDKDHHTLTGENWWKYMNNHFYNIYLNLGVIPSIANEACNKIRNVIKRKENYSLYQDTVETLKTAKERDYKNIILSNNYPDLIEVIEQLGMYHLFNNFVISAIVGYDKPRNEIFEFAKDLYPHSKEFFMVGDSIPADIIGGKNSKMKTILVHKGYNESADYCFNDLHSICSIL